MRPKQTEGWRGLNFVFVAKKKHLEGEWRQSLDMASFKEIREFTVRCYAKDLFDERRKQAMEKKTSLSCGDKHLNEKKSKSICRGNVVV